VREAGRREAAQKGGRGRQTGPEGKGKGSGGGVSGEREEGFLGGGTGVFGCGSLPPCVGVTDLWGPQACTPQASRVPWGEALAWACWCAGRSHARGAPGG